MKTQPTRTITGKILCCLVVLLMAITTRGVSQTHVTMSITSCQIAPNEFQFDFLLRNDGPDALQFNSGSFRMQHSAAIVPAGAHTYSLTYVAGTSDFPAASHFLNYNSTSRLMSLTQSTGTYTPFNIPPITLPVGVQMRVGRYSMKITDTDWVAGQNVGMTYFSSGNGCLVYVNGATTTTTVNQATASTFTAEPQCDGIIPFGCGATILSVDNTTPVTCNGGSDGTIDVSLNSGILPVSWTLDGNPATGTGLTNSFSGLSAGNHTIESTDFDGCVKSVVVFVTEPAAIATDFSDVACDSYLLPWGATATASGDYSFTYTSVDGCDSVVTAHITINLSTSSTETFTACDSYTWAVNGQTYTMSGTYTDVSTNADGCPHTSTLILTINNSSASTETVTACDSYTWAVDGMTYTTSGTYTFVGTNADGCPHTYTLDLTINSSSSSSESATACDSYMWAVDGQTYTMSGTYTFVGTNADGCPHTYTLNLTINSSTTSTETATACDSYTWAVNGQTYTMSGTYNDVSTNADGCPHTSILILTINNSSASTETVTSCDDYVWAVDGNTYSMSGTYTFVGTNADGCPHTYTLVLTIATSSSSYAAITACDSYTWSVNGQTYTVSGLYINTGINGLGCPSTDTLDLTVNYSTTSTETVVACDSYIWPVNGMTYTASGVYTDVSTNADGCPHTSTLDLTINFSSSSMQTVVACDSYTWAVNGMTYTASGLYTFVGTNADGCPHTYDLDLTINFSSSSSETATACDSYTWAVDGQTYTISGIYTFVGVNADGCPHTYTLDLTVGYSTSSLETVVACDSYTWPVDGNTYTASGTYTDVSTNADGCPHTSILDLTINFSSTSTAVATACDSYTWAVNGQVYTNSGIFTFVGTNADGCPHTYNLDLTVYYSTSSAEAATACDSYTWAVDGQTYTTSGIYTFIGTNADGCPHTYTLDLTVGYSTSSTETIVACESYTWPVNGMTYTLSGSYTDLSTNADGCPHTSILDLTINYNTSASATVTICDGQVYTPPGGFPMTATGVQTSVIPNANGCDSTITTFLTVLDPIVVTVAADPIDCYGGTACIIVSATGGSGNYVGTVGTFCGYMAGTWVITVMDDQGCEGYAVVTLTEPDKVTGITTTTPSGCGTADGSATVVASGGDGGPYTYLWSNGSTDATATGLAGGTYTVVITDASGCTGTATATVISAGSVPSAPAVIYGDGGCKGQCATFSIDSVPGATDYTWTLPAGATGSSTGTSITVCFSTKYTGGFICVKANSPCGTSLNTCKNVPVVGSKPPKPGAILGPKKACKLLLPYVETWCVAPVPGAVGYVWSIENNATNSLSIISGQGTTCIQVSIPAGYTGNQKLRVRAYNCKGLSDNRDKDIKLENNLPKPPTSIKGPYTICKSKKDQTYEAKDANGDFYFWTATNGVVVYKDQGKKKVKMDFRGATATTTTLTVVISNSCGTIGPFSQVINIDLGCRVAAEVNATGTTTDVAAVSSLNAYPNPTKGKATITFNADRNANYNIKVVNLIGALVSTEDIAAVEGYNMKEINLDNAPAGIYFVTVQTAGEEARTMRLIVE